MAKFSTSEVLAEIHSFPGLLAAREKAGIIETFDRLRDITPQMAGVEFGRGHMDWCALSSAMRPVLKGIFSALAAEQWPDREYWKNPAAFGREVDGEKKARLGEWAESMEAKYGATQDVPDISAQVLRNLEMNLQL